MTKILVIAYYWPPAGGPGVQRWLSFVEHLPEFQIQPIVLVPENASYPIKDESLVDRIPKDLVVARKIIKEPYGFARWLLGKKTEEMSSGILKEQPEGIAEKLALWIRGNFFIPDARKGWIKPACKKALELIEEHGIKTIVTTGPPHSMHLIGMQLKDRLGIKWIADFRDPWTSIAYHSKLRLSRTSQKKHLALESKVLNTADRIITTSKITAQEFSTITSQPITVITNGYNEDESYSEEIALDKKFSLSFIGSFLSGRNPISLWKSLSYLVQNQEGFKDALEIKLIGVVSEEVVNSIAEYNLSDYLVLLPYVSHKEAIEFQRITQILLLIEIDRHETRGIIPGKLFEYMAAKRPILAIGPEDWEAGQMVRELQCGHYFRHGDEVQMRSQILTWFQDYQNGALIVRGMQTDQYGRRQLAKKLSEVIEWE